MRSQYKRLLWAAMLSCSCAAATYTWYQSTERKNFSDNAEAPIAQVSKVGDEVLRRPSTRLLWQSVNTGDNLYNGETIRTSSRGDIRIQFDDGRFIDLEPDSLIVLQKSKGEIALDLMEGSLFVNAKNEEGAPGGKNAPGLVLNSKGGKVDLSGATASLSKGSGDSLDVQVLEGKAKIQDKDGKSKEVSSGSISSVGSNGTKFDSNLLKIISPLPMKPLFIDLDEQNPVSFKWKGFPAGWLVSVHAGPSRKELKEIAKTEKPESMEIHTKMTLGKHYWKLVATDPTTNQVMGESSIYRTDIQARFAPTVVFPTANLDIPVEKAPANMTFKWQRGEEANRILLEVSKDPYMRDKIAVKSFTKEEEFSLPSLNEGTYYWRMSAYYEGSEKPISGKISKFSLSKIAPIKKDPVQIVWTIPENMLTQYYIEKPLLDLSWEAKNRKEDIAQYRLKIEPEQGTPEETQNLSTAENKMKTPVQKAGRYIASVEAIDKDGNLIGRSDPRQLASLESPLLPAPKLMPTVQGMLKSTEDGQFNVSWEEIKGAKEYWFIVIDKNGKELAKKKYSSNSTNMKNLMPGEYKIKVMAVDQFGRNGIEGEARSLVVPEKSNLRAPTLKKIKVN